MLNWKGISIILFTLFSSVLLCLGFYFIHPSDRIIPDQAIVTFNIDDSKIFKVVISPSLAEITHVPYGERRVFFYADKKLFDGYYTDPEKLKVHANELAPIKSLMIDVCQNPINQFVVLDCQTVIIKNPEGFSDLKYGEIYPINTGDVVECLDGRIGEENNSQVLCRIITKSSKTTGLVFTLPFKEAQKQHQGYMDFRDIFKRDYDNLGKSLIAEEIRINKEREEIIKVLAEDKAKTEKTK